MQMRTYMLCTAMMGFLLIGTSHAQKGSDTSAHVLSQDLIHRIQLGDVAAIAEAGKSGNPAYVPYLRNELRDRRDEGTSMSPAEQAGLALAKLGQQDQLRKLWCNMVTERPAPMGELAYVGGWYSVRILRMFLNGALELQSERPSVETDNDVVYPSLSEQAVRTLASLFPGGPTKPSSQSPLPSTTATEAQEWKAWISNHENELKSMEPNGENVDLSQTACAGKRKS